ncbi:MAG: hypothetical protein ACOX2F_09890 [bacterium]
MNKTGHFNFAENRTFLLCLDNAFYRKVGNSRLFIIFLLTKSENCSIFGSEYSILEGEMERAIPFWR